MLLVLVTLHCEIPATFAQGVTFSINSNNWGRIVNSVAVADVTGSGKPNLISASMSPVGGPATLMALTNNGSGVFGSNETLYVGIGFMCVVPEGVNGGGKPDLIFASDYANTLMVVTNNGRGVFSSNATYSVGSYPIYVLAADINGNGKPDLVCADWTASALTVLTNDGSGVFGSNATYSVGSHPVCVLAVDVNGDGKPDLITANWNDNTLTVLTNNGSGVFGSNATLEVGSNPNCVVAADFNGDGKPDLISANTGQYPNYGNTLTVLTNDGIGGFGSNATLNVGSEPVRVVAADVNGDGKLDLVCANEASNTLTVLTNNSIGGFGSNATLNVGSEPMCVVAADLNGDGKVDLVCGGFTGLTVLLNTTPFPPPSLSIVSGGDQVALSWPGWATNYVLESTTNLSAPEWVAVTNGVPVITGGIAWTNTSPTVFFRLHQF